jgi:pSer/pThr/pTyr-binding forkhead associated (FHA) protein
MKSARSEGLILIHQRTRETYSLRPGTDFVIGRQTGQAVFDHDPKLSGKHCLIRALDNGFAIHDLKSRTGVWVNGSALPQGRACLLKPGHEIKVGDQTFRVGQSQKGGLRSQTLPLLALGALTLMAGVLALFSALKSETAVDPARPANIDQEMREAYAHYRQYGESARQHKFTRDQSLAYLEKDLIPRFRSLHNELQAIEVANHKLPPNREFQRRMAGTLLGQTIATANYIKTGDIRYSIEIEEYNRIMALLNEEYSQRRSASIPAK